VHQRYPSQAQRKIDQLWCSSEGRARPAPSSRDVVPSMKESLHPHEPRTERKARAGQLHPAVPVPVGTRKHPSVPLRASARVDLHQFYAIEHRVGGRDRHWGRLRLLANSHTLGASLAIGGACHVCRPAMQNGDGSTVESTFDVSSRDVEGALVSLLGVYAIMESVTNHGAPLQRRFRCVRARFRGLGTERSASTGSLQEKKET